MVSRRRLLSPASCDGSRAGRRGCSSGCSSPHFRSDEEVRGGSRPQINRHAERQRTATNAIMTAWQSWGPTAAASLSSPVSERERTRGPARGTAVAAVAVPTEKGVAGLQTTTGGGPTRRVLAS
jgi:hypothetical protein